MRTLRCIGTASDTASTLQPCLRYGAATLTDGVADWWRPSAPSTMAVRTTSDTPPFLSLSPRQIRQRERQWGPLWRYRGGAGVSSVATVQHRVGYASGKRRAEPHGNSLIRQQAEAVGLLPPAETARTLKAAASAAFTTEGRGPAVDATIQRSDQSSSNGKTAAIKDEGKEEVSAETEDPLMSFLETHEEDAALLLSMWTSLHRSCVYSSDISESVALRVRYFFHLLIRYRAVAAAVAFYHRLMNMGIQLHQSDLMLLLTNLPYEHSTLKLQNSSEWVRESSRMEKDRQRWRARRRLDVEANGPSRAAPERAISSGNGKKATVDGATYRNMEISPSSYEEEPVRKTAGETPVTDSVVLPPQLAQRLSYAEQPEWVKRWILYEASMGNLDSDDASTADRERSAVQQNPTQPPALEEDTIPDSISQSNPLDCSYDAARAIELTAIVNHLHLLTIGAMDVNDREQKNCDEGAKLRRTLQRTPASAIARSYWHEALQLTHQVLGDSRKGSARWSMHRTTTNVGLEQRETLPAELHATLHAMMRQAQSWRGALTLCQYRSPRRSAEYDAVLFFAVAGHERPWTKSAGVENMLTQTLLPCLVSLTSSRDAVLVLWLVHMCSVKAERLEDFLVLWGETWEWVRRSPAAANYAEFQTELSAMMQMASQATRQCTSTLLQEVRDHIAHLKASEAVATSIRSGAYTIAHREEASLSHVNGSTTDVADGASLLATAFVAECNEQLLPPFLVDSFVLSCHAVEAVIALQMSTAAPHNRVSVASGVTQLLEDVLYGKAGLWSIFALVYAPSERHASAAARRAPERAFVATVLATTILRVLGLLCRTSDSGVGPGKVGVGLHQRSLEMLLECAWRALDEVSCSHLRTIDWRWSAERQVVALSDVAVSSLRSVLLQLNISRASERVLFGAVGETEVRILAYMAKLILKVAELRTTDEYSGTDLLWKQVTHSMTPRLVRVVQLCYGGTASDRSHRGSDEKGGSNNSISALGHRIRCCLNSRETARLSLLFGHHRCRRKGGKTARETRQEVRTVAAPLLLTSTVELDSYHAVRQQVYDILLHQVSPDAVSRALQSLAMSTHSWVENLQLCHIVTRDVSLAPRTCSVDFFALTLSRVADHLTAAAKAARDQERRQDVAKWRAPRRSPSSIGSSSVWLEAIQVYWSAVDHTGVGRNAVQPTPMAHEREILTALLLPLLRISRCTQRFDLGWQWKKIWAALFTASEKQQAAWRRQNILALSVMGSTAALDRCITDLHLCGDTPMEKEALLCRVAAAHADWHTALTQLLEVTGSLEEEEKRATYQLPCSLTTTHTILKLLQRSPTNLSNTALRLFRLQLSTAWDVESSLQLLRMLLRARRWRRALDHVEDVLKRPELVTAMSVIRAETTKSMTAPKRKPPPAQLIEYAALLTLGLQAAAIGGDSASAAKYYDEFKLILHFVEGSTAKIDEKDSSTPQSSLRSATVALQIDDILRLAHGPSATAVAAADHQSVDKPDAEILKLGDNLKELAPRARIFFFRAMTKNLTSSRGEGRDEDLGQTE